MGFTGLGVASTRFGAQTMLDLLEGVETERTQLAIGSKEAVAVFHPEPLRWLFIRFTQWSIKRADNNEGQRNLWLRFLDVIGLGFRLLKVHYPR